MDTITTCDTELKDLSEAAEMIHEAISEIFQPLGDYYEEATKSGRSGAEVLASDPEMRTWKRIYQESLRSKMMAGREYRNSIYSCELG